MVQCRVALHDAGEVALATASLGQNVQTDRRRVILRRGPELVVFCRAIRMLARRGAPYHCAPKAFLRCTLKLFDGVVEVIERHHRGAGETLRAACAIIGEPIVVGTETRGTERAILELEQAHAEAWVQHFGEDPIALLILKSQRGIPRARTNARIAAGHLFSELFRIDARYGEAGHCKRAQPLGGEKIALAPAEILDHAGGPIEETLVDARGPDIGGLDDMGIGGKNSFSFHGRGTPQPETVRSSPRRLTPRIRNRQVRATTRESAVPWG